MWTERMGNSIIKVLFLAFTGIMAIAVKSWERFGDLITTTVFPQQEVIVSTEASGSSIDSLVDVLPCKSILIELSGILMKGAGIRDYYPGINITDEGYNVGCYPQTSTDYETEQMIRFKHYLDEKGIQLLYVNEPAKYIEDTFYQKEFGRESWLNRNADMFLKRIGEAGINYIDLRENIREEGLETLSLFYRTDHHWTVPASKWAAKIIAGRLNEDYGYHIDLHLYDDDRFYETVYRQAWLGEQGKKAAKSYIGMDDYVMLEPVYATSYIITGMEEPIEGGFDIFIDKEIYDMEEDPYEAKSWHYSYQNHQTYGIHNNCADYGKVLVLGDSYEASMIPFLTLGIQDLRLVVLRSMKNQSIHEIIDKGDYDTVIIAYAQFMIGSHDNEENANYRMFTLE